MPEKISPRELQKVGDAIARPAIRKVFEQNPIAALEMAGVNVEAVPQEFVDLLAELSPWELEVIGRVSARAKALEKLEELADHVGVIIH